MSRTAAAPSIELRRAESPARARRRRARSSASTRPASASTCASRTSRPSWRRCPATTPRPPASCCSPTSTAQLAGCGALRAARRRRLRQRLRDEAAVRAPGVSPLRPRPRCSPQALLDEAPQRRLLGDAARHARRHGGGARALRDARLRGDPAVLLQPDSRRALPEGGPRHDRTLDRRSPRGASTRDAGRRTRAIELHAGALRLALRPDLGGAVAGLWHRETPILRSTEPAALDGARASAMFPAAAVLEPARLPALSLEGPRLHDPRQRRRLAAFAARRRLAAAVADRLLERDRAGARRSSTPATPTGRSPSRRASTSR